MCAAGWGSDGLRMCRYKVGSFALRHSFSLSASKLSNCTSSSLPSDIVVDLVHNTIRNIFNQTINISDHRTFTSIYISLTRPHNIDMSSTYRPSMDSRLEKDAMSIKSTSTARSTTSLLRSLLPSKRTKPAKAPRRAETPAEKAARKHIEAEARLAWAMSR